MERWERSYRRDRRTAVPSFSSTLLDKIYRSIDDGGHGHDIATLGPPRAQPLSRAVDPMRKSHHHHHLHRQSANADEKKKTVTTVTEKVVVRRMEADTEYDQHHRRRQNNRQTERLFNSTSSSSESSSGGFSSSEAESVVLSARRKPKPIRTGPPPLPEGKLKPESSIRSRFRASKIYSELKKAKGPVSPGGRLAGFLNNLFTATGNTKKANLPTASMIPASSTAGREEDSTCSSAPSHYRSYLNKAPSSTGKSAFNGVKPSSRFYPVDKDSRPCDMKCLYGRPDIARGTPIAAVKVRKRGEESIGWKEEWMGLDLEFREEMEEEDGGDDDAASCSSSDLFELENLTAVGGERYVDELPVYETTHLNTYRAIA